MTLTGVMLFVIPAPSVLKGAGVRSLRKPGKLLWRTLTP